MGEPSWKQGSDMLTVSQERRDELIGEFWAEVHSRLVRHHHRSGDDADRGIGQYRDALHRRGVGDLVYHQGIEKTAEVVNGIIEHGLPQEP
jgi:hypothetical protein